jgi:hypothetical protein
MQKAEEKITEWLKQNDPSKTLNLSALGLTELPKIPSNCQTLWCFSNKLTALPELQVLELDCWNNELTTLPKLPNCRTLWCSHNQLTVLSDREYQILDCSNNQFTVLPELPHCYRLYCSNNRLTALPELLNCQKLWCYNNRLTILPELPNCHYLHCDDNKYLWITKEKSRKYNIHETPNYPKYAKIIQRNYRRYIIKKYKLLNKYLLRDTIKIVYLYI